MNYSYRKRFKTYDDAEFQKGTEMVSLYYRSIGPTVYEIKVTPYVIDSVSKKKINCAEGPLFKEHVGEIRGTLFFVLKRDVDEAIEFLRNAYTETYQKGLDVVSARLSAIKTANVVYVNGKVEI